MYALVALLLVVLVGAAGGYWAFNKIKDKRNQEFRYEGKITLLKEGADPLEFKDAVLADVTLENTIKEHDLVARWELADAQAAKAHIRQRFYAKVNGLEVTIGYQDKDKNLAKSILESLMKNFGQRQGRAPKVGS